MMESHRSTIRDSTHSPNTAKTTQLVARLGVTSEMISIPVWTRWSSLTLSCLPDSTTAYASSSDLSDGTGAPCAVGGVR